MRRSPWVPILFASLLAGCGSASSECGDDCEEQDLEEAYGPLVSSNPPSGRPTEYPIVLAHGFNGSTTNKWAFYKVADALRRDGHLVFEAEVQPYNSPLVRAGALRRTVDEALKSSPRVNLIAHSMGGLDARVLISELGYGDRVASLTTISTPHRGTAIADVGLKLVREGSISNAVNGIASLWGRTFTEDELAKDSDVRAALLGISETNAPKFNETHPDDARVYYQSWAGVSSRVGIGDSEDEKVCNASYNGENVSRRLEGRSDVMDASLRLGSLIAGHGFGWQSSFEPNDGMVTVESAKWGHFRGCIRADHLDEVGQPKHDQPNLRTKFNHLDFLREIAFDLEKRGF